LELKAEYERLKALQERATENSTFNFNKKRGITAEAKQIKEQKEEAERFERMLKQRVMILNLHTRDFVADMPLCFSRSMS
jgi:structural maintenance of chromosome 1